MKSIRIVNSDKNLGFCALDSKHFIELCLDHLNNPNNFRKLTIDPNTALELTKEHITKQIAIICEYDPTLMKYVKYNLTKAKIPDFYITPKVHKAGKLKGRPITAAHSSPTTPINKILKNKLTKIINQIPNNYNAILKNSFELCKEIDKLTFNDSKRPTIIVIDIESLYPNINLDKFKDLLINEPNCEHLHLLINIIKDCQCVQFQDTTYQQILGIPMGGNSSVETANLYLAKYIDMPFIKQNDKMILLYKRFIDDLIIITHNPKQIIYKLQKIFNKIQLTMNEDIQITTTTAHFLDIWITMKNGKFITSLYQKPLNEFQYLPCTSSHPLHILTGWIYGELTRICRLTTLAIDYYSSKNLFFQRLLQRCYPRKLLQPIFDRHLFTSKNIENKNKSKALALIIPYSNRDTRPIQQVISKHKKLFNDDINMDIMTTWSVNSNLSKILTYSHTNSTTLMDFIDLAIADDND
jgi:hypothetical protein